MKIKDIETIADVTPVFIADGETEIKAGYTSDLLSDVMAGAAEDSVLITIQGHKNTIAVTNLVGIKAIIICNDQEIEEDMLEAAKQSNLSVFTSSQNQFNITCEIASLLNK